MYFKLSVHKTKNRLPKNRSTLSLNKPEVRIRSGTWSAARNRCTSRTRPGTSTPDRSSWPGTRRRSWGAGRWCRRWPGTGRDGPQGAPECTAAVENDKYLNKFIYFFDLILFNKCKDDVCYDCCNITKISKKGCKRKTNVKKY